MFDQVMQGIMDKAQEARSGETGHETDFLGPDGLLYCGSCAGARQMVLDVPLIGQRVVPIMCRCDIVKREQEEAARRAQEEIDRINRMRKIGIQGADYLSMTFGADDGSDPSMTALASRYVAKRREMQAENIGLLLHGTPGGGKTFWAAAIANAMIDNGYSAMVTTIPELITAMSRDFERDKNDVLQQIAEVRFLVLDDIGFERQTTYAAEKMFEVIDARYRSRRPLIVTTNLTMEELGNPQQMEYKRVFDRIVEMCQPVYVSGEGRRKAIAREKSTRARELLGL